MDISKFSSMIAKKFEIKVIVAKLSTPNISPQEKMDLFKHFNDVVARMLGIQTKLILNNDKDIKCNIRSASIDSDTSTIILDNINSNPYICLKDILTMNLLYEQYDSLDEYYQIGDVLYEENILFKIPEIGTYTSKNIKYARLANQMVLNFLNNIENSYKQEYLKNFDNVISDEAIKSIDMACEVCTDVMRAGIYDEFTRLFYDVKNMQVKSELTKQELALLSIDAVLSEYLYSNKEAEKHIKQFVNTFFPLYKDYLNIVVKNSNLTINGKSYNYSEDIFMDRLLIEIEKIEKKEHLLDSLIGNSSVQERQNEGKYSRLDHYFLHCLKSIDACLDRSKLGCINYCTWSKIYKDEVCEDMFLDQEPVFWDLLDDEEFIHVCEQFLSKKQFNEHLIKNIMSMLNKSFGVDFKLNIQKVDDGVNGASDNGEIYLNICREFNNSDILITILHEYRHLIQNHEVDNGNICLSREVYPYMVLNNKRDKFNYNYNYVAPCDIGYCNNFAYLTQPAEYDAEKFAIEFLKELKKRSPIINKCFENSSTYELFEKLKFIDPSKLCLENYKNHLRRVNRSGQYKEDNQEYIEIIEEIKNARSYEDSIEIIKRGSFHSLDISERIRVYELFAQNEFTVSYDSQMQMIFLNGKGYNIRQFTNYGLLEEMIKCKAKYNIQHNLIKMKDKNDYIYNQFKLITPKVIDSFNCTFISDFYRGKDKYRSNRIIDKKDDMKRKVGN